MPQVLDWVKVGTFWGSTPPVDVLFLEEGLRSPGRVFRVIVLHEPVIGKLFSDKEHKGRLQDVAEEISIHDAVKDANLCGTMSANSSPDMNFERMLWFPLPLRGLVNFPITCAPILLEGNGALITENYVMESVATIQDTLCVLQPLDFVSIADELTISGPLKSPALLLARSSYGGRTHGYPTFCQPLLNLLACSLVILLHLLIYKCFCIYSQLFWSS